jgi:nicotinate phosphoribosyltransferase
MENGIRVSEAVTLSEIAGYSKERLARLPEEYKRFNFPHVYKVGLSASLLNEREKLVEAYKQIR